MDSSLAAPANCTSVIAGARRARRVRLGALGRSWPRLALLALGLLLMSLIAGCATVAAPQGWADPVFAGNGTTIYYGTGHGQIEAYDTTSQKMLWDFPSGQQAKTIKLAGIYSTPVLDSQTLYFGAYDGNIYALDQSSGQFRWAFNTGSPIIGGILLKDGTLYTANSNGRVLALRASDGQKLWQQQAGQRVWSTPIDAGNLIVVTSMDKSVYAFDTQGGLAWHSRVAQAAIASTPSTTGGQITFGAFDKRFYAIQQSTGDKLWDSPTAGSWFWTRGLVSGGDLYAGNLDGSVYDIDASSGALKWHTDLGAPIRSAPVLAQGVLIVAARSGMIHGLDPQSGKDKWTPIDAGGQVLANLVQQNTTTYALTEANGKANARLLAIDAANGSSKSVGTP